MFQMFVIGVQLLPAIVLGFFTAYLFGLAVLAAFARASTNVKPTTGRRFAVLIPAHNEEPSLEPTIRSFLESDYPRERFDVIVVADNCTDRTADVGRRCGALVLERTDRDLRGKGYALRWCMDQLLSGPVTYDAFVVVDADSVASGNFLGIMNAYHERGARVIQSSDLVVPQPGIWNSEMTRLGFTLYNYVRPLGRRLLGCSAGLRGNGMCFAADVLRTHPWNAYSRTEDLEFGLHLLLNGIPVVFAPEAIVFATMPRNPRLAESQRARWEGGRLPVIKRSAFPLLRKGILHGSLSCLDALIDLVTPALINLMVMITGGLLFAILLFVTGISTTSTFIYLWSGIFLLGILHMFIGLYAAKADGSLYKALLYLPRYTVWKILLYLKLVRLGKTQEWIRTTREPEFGSQKSPQG